MVRAGIQERREKREKRGEEGGGRAHLLPADKLVLEVDRGGALRARVPQPYAQPDTRACSPPPRTAS